MKSVLGGPFCTIVQPVLFGHRLQIKRCETLRSLSRCPPFRCMCCTVAAAPVSSLITSDLVEQEFSELNLKHVFEKVGGVRTRQHVNPLKASLMVPVLPPRWEDVFSDPSLPIAVDIGSGSGRFAMLLAKRNAGSCNYLGLEIRHQLVVRANNWAAELNLSNVCFIYANATVSFGSIMSTYPGPLKLVTILCPDPHFKSRHHKRRIVQMQLVEKIIDSLAPGGKVFLQSDVKEVAEDMRRQFEVKVDAYFLNDLEVNPSSYDKDGWLLDNCLGVRSEREIHAIAEGGQMYRSLYMKAS